MKMDWSEMVPVLLVFLLLSSGAQSLKPEHQASAGAGGGPELPWHYELCCDSPGAHLTAEDSTTLRRSQCNFRSLTNKQRHQETSVGRCVDVVCRIEENWTNLTCELRSQNPAVDASPKAMSFQRVASHADGTRTSDDPVTCEGKYSFRCSLPLDETSSDVILNISVSDVGSSVRLKIPPTPVKPGRPINVSHHQTIESELILTWQDTDTDLLRYEVRYSSNVTHPAWQIVPVFEEHSLSLDLKVKLNYTVQVRCSSLVEPPMWSQWSEPHHIYLDTVSYIPEIVKARPGENITVYCVFNDRNFDASTAMWTLNLQEPLHSSQYHPVNQWVSRITVQPSEIRMYDLLQCTQQCAIPYSQIYVEGAAIAINCQTNGDIDAMDCSWKNKEWTDPKFRSRWADLPCDVMEEKDRAGDEVGELGPLCNNQKSCTIRPLRMNCYKLWLEMDSPLGPIKSKPIYVSPIEHVKPRPPTNVMAGSRSTGVLAVTWKPPSLPAQGLQCQFRYHSLSTVTAQPEWKIQAPVLVPRGEASVPDMCSSYAVQVRCIHIHGTGYWSDWSETVYSVPQNSHAPERGPDFWRRLSDDANRNETTVTLLFEDLQIAGPSYCVDGFIIKHQPLNGSATEERIAPKPSYSFDWNQEVQTVTVETYNSLGRSTNNFNMTLNRQVRRRCLRSFHVLVINSTCVSLSWTLLDNESVPQFMVVQWSLHKQQEAKHHKGQTWKRLHYSDRPVYLRGDFFSSEEYDFYLYPVFADGEGEPVHTKAVRRDAAAYMLLMIVSFVSIVLLITLILTQNQMKKIVWKDVPNPNKCSWAEGLDFRKVDSFDQLFRSPERLTAWPLLLPAEKISRVVILDKADISVSVQPLLVSLSSDPATTTVSIPSDFDPEAVQTQAQDSERLLVGAPSSSLNVDVLDILNPEVADLLPEQTSDSMDSSAQSSVTYATVLLADPTHKQHFRDGSGCSSSDEGNFSANNSDISESLHGALWELDSCKGGEMDDNRRSCSYNSVEELSESSEPEDDKEMKQEKVLYYLGMNCGGEESEEEHNETKSQLLKSLVLNREDCSYPLLDNEDSNEKSELLSVSTGGSSPLYLPQFRTAPFTAHSHEAQL